ncbi:YdcH family protein [Aquisediminimonas sediminicola]|uniref:YdcH family protein n=1 Tax=Alteraquisediminimonas sediminicola TaxID=2676787 RepID=UPI001C8E38B0|nr:YdcH family protein [Aquisediminimonas sediminicola]
MAQSRPHALLNKHNRLQENISREMQRPNPDDFQIQRWKKEKLVIKEELARA